MKVALVTGVAGGIGFATAELLLKNGYAVVGMDVLPAMPKALEGDFTYCQGDLSKAESRQNYVNTALAAYGRIDALVNVAGVAPKVRNDILEMTEESYDFVMNINTKGNLFLTQLVANVMKNNEGENKGSIVNISSMSGYTSSVSRGEYCISKAGLAMATKLFADRLAEDRINVYELRPGIVETDMTAVVHDKYAALIEGGLLPIKRMGVPEDIGRAVLGLSTGLFAYSTGDVINLDGGFHISRL